MLNSDFVWIFVHFGQMIHSSLKNCQKDFVCLHFYFENGVIHLVLFKLPCNHFFKGYENYQKPQEKNFLDVTYSTYMEGSWNDQEVEIVVTKQKTLNTILLK